jgi:GT2 family glycosyltransferase
MWLNPDLVIEAGELDKWFDWMEAHPDVGVSGPRLMNADGTDQESCYQFPNPFIPILRRTPLGKLPGCSGMVSRYRMEGLDRTQEHEVDWVLGAAHLIRRDTFEKVGWFDERFFLYFEDADVCRRVWLAGQRVVYTPVARILHYYQKQSQTKNIWQALKNPVTRIHIASGFKYFAKYFGQPNPRLEYQKTKAKSL